jgi:hypothetical protein
MKDLAFNSFRWCQGKARATVDSGSLIPLILFAGVTRSVPFHSWSGGTLSPLGTSATRVVSARDDDRECGAVGGMRAVAGEIEVLGEKSVPVPLCPSQNATWPGCRKLATNRLSYGTAYKDG